MGFMGPAKRQTSIDISRPITYTSQHSRSPKHDKPIRKTMMKSASTGILLNPISSPQQQQHDIIQERKSTPPITTTLSPVIAPPKLSHSSSAIILRPWDGEGIAAGMSSQAQKEGWNRTESGVAAALEQRDPQVRSGQDPRLVVTIDRNTTLASKHHMHAGEHIISRKEMIRNQRQAPVKFAAPVDVASMMTYGKPSLLLNQHRYHTDAQLMDDPSSNNDSHHHQHHESHHHEEHKEHSGTCICNICNCGAHKCSAPNFSIPRSAHYDPNLSSLYNQSFQPYSKDAIPKRWKPKNEFVYENKPFVGESCAHSDYVAHPVLLPSQQRGQFSSAASSNIFGRNIDVIHDDTTSPTPQMTTSQVSYPGYCSIVDTSIRERTRKKVHGHQKLFYDTDSNPTISLSHQELPAHPIQPHSRKQAQERRQANAKSTVRVNLVDPGYAQVDGEKVADAKFSGQTTYSDYADFSQSRVARAKRPVTPHFVTADLREFESEYSSQHRQHPQPLCPARNLHRSEPALPVGGHAHYEQINGAWLPAKEK